MIEELELMITNYEKDSVFITAKKSIENIDILISEMNDLRLTLESRIKIKKELND